MNNFPEKDSKDKVHTIEKTVASLVTTCIGAGGIGGAIFETIFTPPIEKRKQEWLNSLANLVNELSGKIDNIEKKLSNEEFISFYMHASNIAMRTHNEEKLKILKSAVKNSLLQENINESKKMIFLKIIDEITPFHIQFFDFLLDPAKYIEKIDTGMARYNRQRIWQRLYQIWETHHEGIDNSWRAIERSLPFNQKVPDYSSLAEIAFRDFVNYGFITGYSSFSDCPANNMIIINTLGKEFAKFIDV